jgi:L-2-hydroxyglutarate oxidase LhgO
MVKTDNPVGIVGAGIVGLAVARQLARSQVPVLVFDKEQAVGQHQTGHNSGVVHAGIYYAPGSAKAVLTRRGVELLRAYCADRGLPWDERGKLVIARNDAETVRLRELERRSIANGVPGLRWLNAAELGELEPDVAGQAALLSPTTAIADFPAITRGYADDVTGLGGQVLTGTQVTGVRRRPDDTVDVITRGGTHHVSRLIICAGLQSDQLARTAGDDAYPEIIPFRGEYMRLRPHARDRVKHLIYPVPDPAYPFLGVHLTPRIGGEVDLGPNAVLALAREGYRRADVSAEHLLRLARSAAFRHLARQNWRAGLHEMRGSLSRRAFIAEARTYLPWLGPGDVMPAPAGVRAQAVDADGSLVDDFRINRIGPITTVRNAPSPAATASLAIAEHIVSQITATPALRSAARSTVRSSSWAEDRMRTLPTPYSEETHSARTTIGPPRRPSSVTAPTAFEGSTATRSDPTGWPSGTGPMPRSGAGPLARRRLSGSGTRRSAGQPCTRSSLPWDGTMCRR